ncbi:hypothetical protein CBM2626_B130048 [Cupriavidus taiwanensis]|nr:hypothetical protein CBM2626_B130048 [Cupriavidus taiwanensis]
MRPSRRARPPFPITAFSLPVRNSERLGASLRAVHHRHRACQARVDSPTFHIDTDTAGHPCLHLGTFPNRSFSRFFNGAIPGMLADAVRWPIYHPPQGNCLIFKDS